MSVNDYDVELLEAIRDLRDDGQLEEKSAAFGIAMQVVWQGEGSLSTKQSYIYQSAVVPLLIKQAENREWDRRMMSV